jgi:hypothetical protein
MEGFCQRMDQKSEPDREYDRCCRRAQSSSTGGGEARDSCDGISIRLSTSARANHKPASEAPLE